MSNMPRPIKAQGGGQRDRYQTRRLKALSNAIVLQQIYPILHFIVSYELNASSYGCTTKGGV